MAEPSLDSGGVVRWWRGRSRKHARTDDNAVADTHISDMSRAFVNEDRFEEMPDRPISQHPNLVTEHGLTLIEAALDTARREYGEAQAAGDREALAKAGRDLRYWSVRRANARVPSRAGDTNSVQFGHAVTILRENGRRQIFRIVGEDEADPAKGSISYVSPLARALLGKRVGDSVRAGNDQAEITAIE
jgi:transcription elongation GreA/GreB family factor